jgi:outer membrane biosynthesis protein TonB
MQKTDTNKNVKAGTYTGIICGTILMLCFLISWTNPLPEVPPVEEGIEVNLGDSDQGLGDEAPMVPGPPAAAEDEVNTPPKSQLTQQDESKEVETDDNDKEAPEAVVPKPAAPKPEAKKIPTKETSPKTTKSAPQVVNTPAPAPKKPAAVYKGGTASGTGGNEADSYNSTRNQGIAGGKGDQGKPGGNPDSDSYTGNGGTGNSGVSISRGLQGRRISKLPSFEDDFNQNAKVAIDVKVDGTGKVVSATYQPKGSTTSDAGMRSIAIQKARQIKFTPSASGGEESIGTIIFNFRLKN